MKTKLVAVMHRHWISSLAPLVVAALALATFVFVPVPAAAQCDQLFAKYEKSSWWGGAFGNCRKQGGTVNPDAIFDCAWKQVPAPENTACLKGKLRVSPVTQQHIAAVVVFNGPPPCDKLYAKYEGSSWWGGAFGNCRKYGGTVDRTAIFECAWKQVPAPENTACLKGKLLSSPSTKIHTDAVVAFNRVLTCDQLFARYEGSSWWWGAFGKSKKRGGTVDRTAIFESAWSLVPAPENTACLKGKLVSSASTKKAIDEVVTYNTKTTDTQLPPPSTCPGGKFLSGFRSAGPPKCWSQALSMHPTATVGCDSAGYYCIEAGKRIAQTPDCMSNVNAGAELVVQGGITYGCYVKSMFP